MISLEVNESRRVDRQLFGRAARQGDPGSGQAIFSLEDDLLLNEVPSILLGWTGFFLKTFPDMGAALGRGVIEARQRALRSRAFELDQAHAGRLALGGDLE